MSRFQRPPDAPSSPGMGSEAAYARYGPVPWSVAAIVAFVFALLICIPIFPLLGIILGVVGILATSGGRRRGRRLAVAAIPIAVVTCALGSLGWFLVFISGRQMIQMTRQIEPILQASPADLPELTEAFRELATEDFREAVSSKQLQVWVQRAVSEHGKLVEITKLEASRAEKGVLLLKCKFVKRPATVRIKFTYNFRDLKHLCQLEDVEIEGSSPRDPAEASDTESESENTETGP